MFANFLQRLTIFEGNVPRDDILNGLGHLNYSTLQNAACNLIKDFLGLLGDSLSWSTRFEHPVPGLATLRDAADYIQKLSKAEQKLPHWQAAVEALIMAAEGRGPLLHACVGMLRADRKDTHWGKRKLKRER